MNLTRRDALRGSTATLAAIACGGAVAGAAVPALTGTDARLEELYRAWQAAEADYCRVCELDDPAGDAEVKAASDFAGDALLALAAVPAVSVRGVLIKLQAWDEDGGDGRDCTEAVRESAFADLRRLARELPS
jgi:hypothetical protein